MKNATAGFGCTMSHLEGRTSNRVSKAAGFAALPINLGEEHKSSEWDAQHLNTSSVNTSFSPFNSRTEPYKGLPSCNTRSWQWVRVRVTLFAVHPFASELLTHSAYLTQQPWDAEDAFLIVLFF